MIPYKFDEGAASKIANKLGSAASSAIQFRGKYKAAPLVAQEEAEAKAEANKKAKSDSAEKQKEKETNLSSESMAKSAGRIAVEGAKQNTTKNQIELSKTKTKEKSTPRAVTPKPTGQVTPAKKKAANPAAKLTPAKTTVKTRDDNTSVGRSVPGVFGPTNPKKPQLKKVKPNLDPDAAERYNN
jgi:hypothetical protein